jgi:hypothetical protein
MFAMFHKINFHYDFFTFWKDHKIFLKHVETRERQTFHAHLMPPSNATIAQRRVWSKK